MVVNFFVISLFNSEVAGSNPASTTILSITFTKEKGLPKTLEIEERN